MSKITNAVTLSLSAAFAMAALSAPVHAESAFKSQTLSQGYQLAANDAKPMEGKCGADHKKTADGKCGASKAAGMTKAKDGKCGEGKCGANMKKKMMKEGKCGADKMKDGKCGADKK